MFFLVYVWLKRWKSGMIENEYIFAMVERKKNEKKKMIICGRPIHRSGLCPTRN